MVEPDAVARERASAAAGVTGHADLDALLAAGGVEGVVITAPSDRHLALVERCAGAGLAVFCEKPCGLVAGDARRAAASVAAAGVPFQVGYYRRFVPELVALKARIDAGELGTLSMLTLHQWDEHPPPARVRGIQRRHRDRHGRARDRPAALADRAGVIGGGGDHAGRGRPVERGGGGAAVGRHAGRDHAGPAVSGSRLVLDRGGGHRRLPAAAVPVGRRRRGGDAGRGHRRAGRVRPPRSRRSGRRPRRRRRGGRAGGRRANQRGAGREGQPTT